MSNEAKVGIFVFITIVIFVILSLKIGEIELTRQKTYPFTMVFTSVEGLKQGAPLEMSGVIVGSATSIRLRDDNSVAVEAELNRNVKLPVDSVAVLTTKGVLGDRVITLRAGTSETLIAPNGNLARTEVPPTMESLLSQLGEVATNLSQISGTVNAALGEDDGQARLAGIMENLYTFSEDAARLVGDNRDEFAAMVHDLREVTTSVADMSATMSGMSEDLAAIISAARSGEGTLGRLLTDDELYLALTDIALTMQSLSSSMSEENTLTLLLTDRTVYDNVLTLSENLNYLSTEIASGRGTVGHLLVDEELYEDISGAVKSAKGAAQGLEEQTPISVMGTILGLIY